MKISAFTLITNAFKFQYPFIESIKSWLPVVDELVVIDGGSVDGSDDAIQAIGSNKIRIVSDKETKWEDDWEYSRMGKNFNRGFQECNGDIVVKFDIDYVLHERAWKDSQGKDYNFFTTCQKVINNNDLILGFDRKNFVLADRWFGKSIKTLGVNKIAVKKRNIPVVYGFDYNRWKLGYEPVVPEREENGIYFGTLLRTGGNVFNSDIDVFNYGFTFCTKETIRWIRQRHIKAEVRQMSKQYKYIKPSTISLNELENNPNYGLNKHIDDCLGNLTKTQIPIKLTDHPEIMQEKVKNIKPEQQGYNLWGQFKKEKYEEV